MTPFVPINVIAGITKVLEHPAQMKEANVQYPALKEARNLSSGILHCNPSASVGNTKRFGMPLATQLNDVCDENTYVSTLR